MKQGYVRFCGGCNPRFDRGEARKIIQAAVADCIEFSIFPTEHQVDIMLVIRGCTACPYELEQFSAKHRVILSAQEEISDVIAQIRTLCSIS